MTTLGYLEQAARSGRLTRRQVLERSLQLGLSSATILGLMAAAPDVSASPGRSPSPALRMRAQGDPSMMTVVVIDGVEDADPHSNYGTYGALLDINVYEMLVQYKDDSLSEIEPMLADSWEISEDNTTFTFKIPAGVTFHDGSPCDSSTVKFSFTRLIQMEMGPYLVASRFISDPETQIETPDPQTVVFRLSKPEPIFLAALASSYGPYVVSPTDVEANKTEDDPWAHEWFRANANGTGPYRLTQNDPVEGFTLERFENYHRGWTGGEFETVAFRVVAENATRRQLIENGEADLLTASLTEEDYAALEGNAELTVMRYPTTRVSYLIVNAVTLSADARKGLSYAFPYEEVIQGVYKGQIKRTGPIADSVRGYDPEVFVYPTDLVQAKELLTAGGVPEGSTISMMTISQDEDSRVVSELFLASLAEIGITLEITAVEYLTVEETVYGDQPAEEKPHLIGLWSWWPDYNDASNQLEPIYAISSAGGGGSNAGYYNNARLEEILAEVHAGVDDARYSELMKEAQDIVVQQDPASIFIGQSNYTSVLRADVQGFIPNPLYLEQYILREFSRVQS